MPLNKDVLGIDLNEALKQFQDKTPEQVGDMEAFRLQFCKVIADEVIKHFIANGVINVTVTVNTVGGPTAQSGGGTGTGTIS